MNQPTIQSLVLIGFLLLLLPQVLQGLRFLRFNSTAAHRQRAQAAERRGWQYKPGPFGRSLLYSVTGTAKEGVIWKLEVFRQRVTRKGSLTPGFAYSRWMVEKWQPDSNSELLIAPRLPEMGRFLESFYGRQFMLRSLLTPDAAHLANLPEVAAGSDSLRQRYLIRAGSELAGRRLVASDVESLLLDWPAHAKKPFETPMVLLGEDSLQIKLLKAVYDLPTIDYLVNLGQALVSAQMKR